MRRGTAFIAFSLHPEDDELHVSKLSGHRTERNEVQESTFSNLEMYNERGLEETATIIGKYVLGILQIEHPEKFKQYPNLLMEIPKGPSMKEIQRMDERLRFLADQEGSDS